MAGEESLMISKDEIERARLMSEYKYEVDTQSKVVHARREGRLEGRQEANSAILEFINAGYSLEDIKKRLQADKNLSVGDSGGIAMAGRELLRISKDEIERARLMSEYKYVVDTQSKVVQAKREGMKEGMEKGRQEGKQEANSAILELINAGYSLEDIKKRLQADKNLSVRDSGEIATAGKELQRISKEEIEWARSMSEYKYELDTQSKVVQARREGRLEGIQEGMEEAIQEGMREGKRKINSAVLELINAGYSLEDIKKRLQADKNLQEPWEE
jgi:DNA-binding transcriptional MerR regulator